MTRLGRRIRLAIKIALFVPVLIFLAWVWLIMEIFNPSLYKFRTHITDPLYYAVINENITIINILSKVPYYRNKARRGFAEGPECAGTPLEAAVSRGSKEITTILLNNGANFNICRFTPIEVAIRNNDLDMIKLLVSYGADIHEKPNAMNYIAHAAGTDCNKDSPVSDIMLYFIGLGLDVNERQYYSETYYKKNYEEYFKLTKTWFEKPKTKYRNKEDMVFDRPTPLVMAAEANCLNNTKTLLEHGANRDLSIYRKPFSTYMQDVVKRNPDKDYNEILSVLFN